MMKPLNNYILVRLQEEQSKMNGLIIPKGSDTDPKNLLKDGIVEQLSTHVEEMQKDIKVGDRIYFNKHAVTKIPNQENLILVRLEDLYLVD